MRNKLTFPTAGMETKYVWDRHNIQNNGIYIWDKHNIIEETKYYWDKYALLEEKWYYWKQYETANKITYNWNRYIMVEADATFTTNNYIQQVYNTETKTKYLNLNKDFGTTPVPDDTYVMTGQYVYLYKADNTYIRLNITDVKNNCFTCNPLYYGFVGVSYDLSYNYPYYYFTPDTRMYVDTNNKNYLTFTNLYNTTRNIKNKPTSLTDSPTGSYYIELTMKWPTTLKNAYTYSKSSNLTNKFSFITGTTFYDMLNDGFWRDDSYAVGGLYKDNNSLTALSSENSTAYPTGISGNYFYVKTADTLETIKGDYLQQVSSKEQNAYPENGEQNGYWYETTVAGLYYWDVYNTKIEKYLFDKYEYNATILKEIVANRYKASTRTGVTFVNAKIKTDTNGEYYTEYTPVSTGALTSVTWPAGGRDSTNIAFWLSLDVKYKDGYSIDVEGKVIPITSSANYTESLVDYNNTLPEDLNALYGKSMLENTNIVGIGFRNGLNYLFTPSTVWGRESGTGAVSFNDVIPTSFNGWIPSNAVTAENGGYYVNYIKTINRIWDSRLTHWEMDTNNYEENFVISDGNALLYEIPADVVPLGNLFSNTYDGVTTRYIKDGYIYVFNPSSCDYYGEVGEYLGTTFASYDAREDFPQRLTTATSSSIYLELTGYEYGKGWQLIGQVTSREENTYPADGMIEGNDEQYYVYSHFEEEDSNYIKGEFIEQVESTNPDEYPLDKYQGQNWYVYTGNKLFKYKGDYIETVNAETVNSYPKDGITGGYWYIYQRYEDDGPYKSRWVDEVETNQSGTYPSNGIQGDYWYVYKKSYDGYKLQINDWQIKGGVDYKHNINPEKDFTIGCVASAEIDFDYDNTADDFQQYLDADYCDYWTWQPEDSDWRLIGRFWLTDAEYNRNLVKVKAFDAILATDAYVDEFIANTTYPISVTNFFNNLCQLLGVTGEINSSLTNTTFAFQDNFQAINITARQLLQYIAEATGGFIKVEPDGTLHLTTYSSSGKTLDNSNYTSYAKQRYTVEPISGLTVKMNSDDLGVSSGDVENNPYIIENNPLFYTQSDEEIAGAVYRLYHSINDKVYRPATIQLLQDFGINCGDIITINGDTFYVMNKELSASGCKLECFGNQYRDKKAQSINSDIVALRGKTNELYRDLEMTQSTLTDTANGLQSQITQTAEEINLRVTNEVEGLESEISQTAEQISTRVTNEVAGLESKITQTADSITSTVTDEINQAKSEIKQTTDSISLEVQNQGDLVAQLVLDVDGISAKGYVTFTDLAGSGTTTINGSNITTGTISADRINLKGAISWSDLDDDCQDTIIGYGGDTLPSYIKSTYISATEIRSPTIYGATIYAGLRDEGYCKMTASGLNVVSDTGGNICGIGWHPGYYNLPYLVLGSGVDDVGTDQGLIKKYTHGIWIGDSDNIFASNEQVPTSGTGIFVDFVENKVYKYTNGTKTAL